MRIILIYFTCAAYFAFHSVLSNTKCLTKPSKYLKTKKDLTNTVMSFFSNFNKFSDLILDCNQTYNITSYLQFYPRQTFRLDDSFSLKKFIDYKQLKLVKFLLLSNMKGLDMNSKGLGQTGIHIKLDLMLIYSKLDIYQNNEIIKNECNLNVYNETSYFLSSFSSLYFRQVVYPQYICPLLFRESNADQIFFTDITNSFLVKNRLRFHNKETSYVDLKARYLFYAYFEIYYESITSDLMSISLFSEVKAIAIVGNLNSIQSDLLSKFKHVNCIQLKISNLKELYHKGNAWMSDLNSRITLDLSGASFDSSKMKQLLVLIIVYPQSFVSFDIVYEYPEEDLCLFKDYPHRHLVYPVIYPGKKINCSCTLKWIHAYNYLYQNLTNYNLSDYYTLVEDKHVYTLSSAHKYCKDEFKQLKCDLENRLKLCNMTSIVINSYNYFKLNNDVDIFFLLKWSQFILLVILQPILCFMSIIFNFLIIIVIKNKTKRVSFKNEMYSYILINGTFNIFYCVIMLLKQINICVFYISPSICSSVYQTKSSQYFKIICVLFLGNVFKTCSNFSYLFFSISRLMSTFNDTDIKHFKKFKKINLKHFVITILALSSVLSVYILFQYEINEEKDYRKEFPFETRNENFCVKTVNIHKCRMFNAFKMVNNIINGVLFVLLNIIIDLFLLREFKKNLKSKSKMEFNKSKAEEYRIKMKRLTKMVIINGLIYFLSNIIEFLVTIMLISFSRLISHFCNEKFSCDLFKEEAEFFILFWMISNFFILNHFNISFNNSYQDLKSKIHKFFHTFSKPNRIES